MRSATFSRLLVLAVLVSATFAFTQAGDTLTNDAVVKMVRAELSTRIILTTIQSAPSVTFDLSPSGLIALKAEGVDDQIITAMQARVQGAGAAEAAREKSERSPVQRSLTSSCETSRRCWSTPTKHLFSARTRC